MPPTFLITSAAGGQEGAAVRILLKRGAKIHAPVRKAQSSAYQDLKKLGVTLFEGGFDDVSAIQTAARGVSEISLNLWPTPGSQYHSPELASEHTLAHAFEPGRRMAHLDAADVGKYAAQALLRPETFNGKVIEIGHQNLTPEGACTTICEVSGRQIALNKRAPEEVKNKAKQLPILPFQLLANEEDITIDSDALEETCGITCSTFASFLAKRTTSLIHCLRQLSSYIENT